MSSSSPPLEDEARDRSQSAPASGASPATRPGLRSSMGATPSLDLADEHDGDDSSDSGDDEGFRFEYYPMAAQELYGHTRWASVGWDFLDFLPFLFSFLLVAYSFGKPTHEGYDEMTDGDVSINKYATIAANDTQVVLFLSTNLLRFGSAALHLLRGHYQNINFRSVAFNTLTSVASAFIALSASRPSYDAARGAGLDEAESRLFLSAQALLNWESFILLGQLFRRLLNASQNISIVSCRRRMCCETRPRSLMSKKQAQLSAHLTQMAHDFYIADSSLNVEALAAMLQNIGTAGKADLGSLFTKIVDVHSQNFVGGASRKASESKGVRVAKHAFTGFGMMSALYYNIILRADFKETPYRGAVAALASEGAFMGSSLRAVYWISLTLSTMKGLLVDSWHKPMRWLYYGLGLPFSLLSLFAYGGAVAGVENAWKKTSTGPVLLAQASAAVTANYINIVSQAKFIIGLIDIFLRPVMTFEQYAQYKVHLMFTMLIDLISNGAKLSDDEFKKIYKIFLNVDRAADSVVSGDGGAGGAGEVQLAVSGTSHASALSTESQPFLVGGLALEDVNRFEIVPRDVRKLKAQLSGLIASDSGEVSSSALAFAKSLVERQGSVSAYQAPEVIV